MSKIKLFCLPFAGGSAMSYLSWKRHMNEKIDLRPVELAGRGRRINEALYGSLEQAVEDIYTQVSKEVEDCRYAVFGHSMGTVLAYELASMMRNNGYHEPLHIFFSGRYPPFINNDTNDWHLLPDQHFVDRISQHGGMSEELLNNREILSFFIPVIRADYKMIETYRHSKENFTLNCDVTILNGKQDKYVSHENVKRWTECTNKHCKFYEFDGGHFFINDYKQDIVRIINDTLANY